MLPGAWDHLVQPFLSCTDEERGQMRKAVGPGSHG